MTKEKHYNNLSSLMNIPSMTSEDSRNNNNNNVTKMKIENDNNDDDNGGVIALYEAELLFSKSNDNASTDYSSFNNNSSCGLCETPTYPHLTSRCIINENNNKLSNIQKLQLTFVEVTCNSITNKLSDDVATTTTSEIEYMNNTNESFFATAVNNFAIVSLHLKCIKEAVRYLEDLIKENPTLYLIDPIIFNLCTMYDLICAPAISTQKKKAIQIIANYYDIEDPILHWRCFRLSSGNAA